MIETIVANDDFYFFALGFIFLLAFFNCQVLKKILSDKLAWIFLSLFSLSQSAYFGLNLIQQFKNVSSNFDTISIFFSALSFSFLGAFALNIHDHNGELPKIRKWFFIPLIGAGTGFLYSLDVFAYSQAVFIGFPAIFAASYVFIKRTVYKTRLMCPWQKATGVSLVVYNAVGLLVDVGLINPGSSAETGSKIFLSALFLISLWFCSRIATEEEILPELENSQKSLRFFLPVSLLIVLPLGYMFSIFISERNFNQEKMIKKSQGNAFESLLEVNFAHSDLVAEGMSRSSVLAEALSRPCSETIDMANAEIDRFSSPFPRSVAYLLDLNGNTIVSSNRNSDQSFVGKNFSFRPYFKGARAGQTSFYLARGTVSKEYGCYCAYPVRVDGGSVLGVVVYKNTMENVVSHFADQPATVLLDDKDEIIASNRPDEFWSKLFPIDKTSFISFADISSFRLPLKLSYRPVLSKESIAGYEKNLFLWRYNLDVSDWSFYLLEESASSLWSRLLGISLTLLACLVLIVIAIIWSFSLTTVRVIKKSARVYHTLVEGSSNIVALMDISGQFIALNEAGKNEFQLTDESFSEVRLPDLWDDDSVSKVRYAIQETVTEKKVFFEASRSNAEGQVGYWEITLNPIVGTKFRPSQLIGIFHNISARKLAAKELNREKEFTANLLNTAQAIILFLDMTGRVKRVNQYFYDLTGFKKEEVINKNWLEAFVPDSCKTNISKYFREHSTNLSEEPVINDILKANSETLKVEWKNRTLLGDDREPVGVIAVGQDITEHTKIEDALREGKTKFAMLNNCFIKFGNSPRENINLLTDMAWLLTGSDIAMVREIDGDEFNMLSLSSMSEELSSQQAASGMIESCPFSSEIAKIGKSPILIKNISKYDFNSSWIQTFNSMIVCAIYLGEEITGCLMCCFEKTVDALIEEDLELINIVARAIGIEIARLREDRHLRQVIEELASKDKRMSLEMEIARTVHRAFLPSKSPEFSPYRIGFVFKPCFSVGGDFFDFVAFPEKNQLGILFADISGHGVAGALLASMLKVLLTSVTLHNNEPASILYDMNGRIEESFPSGYFVAAFFAVLDSTSESITFASAAPEPVLLLKKSGKVEKIGDGGQPMGLLPAEFTDEESFVSVSVKMEPGDMLIFFTDGITDIKISENERIGVDRLCDWVSELSGSSAQDLSEEIYRRAIAAAIENGIDDDIMILAIKRE
ncbi:MAG: SpoIIE family protein phosphatase [Candidatus Riflebacteria bacterium]|nr:SpoIIE family protein phosphatase [Candidatus Riflebacteria bacterium]